MKFNLKPEEIKYVKIFYEDANGLSCMIKTAIRSISDRTMVLSSKNGATIKINCPQIVDIHIVCNDGLYKTKTELKSFLQDGFYLFFTLEIPKDVEYHQEREFFRVSAICDCVYRVEKNNSIVEFKAKTSDISANGVSIIVPELVFNKTYANLTLDIENKKILVKVYYIRSEKLENGYKLSFTFIDINEIDRDFISRFCIKKQLQDKRKNLY